MSKKINQICLDCALNLSHEAAEQRDCFVGRACVSERSRYRNREDDLERQSAAYLRRKQQGHSRRRFRLPINGHRLPPVIKLILYRDTQERAGFKNARFRVTLAAQNRPSFRRSLSLNASGSMLSETARNRAAPANVDAPHRLAVAWDFCPLVLASAT